MADLTSLLSSFLSRLYAGTVDVGGSGDALLVRDAANVVAQRNAANAQALRVYNTFTDASNYERGMMGWASNRLQIGVANAGTGSARSLDIFGNGISVKQGSTDTWYFLVGGNLVSAGNYAVGYGSGGGGTVTQATSKATGVQLDKVTGEITMNNASLAAATAVGFTLTNNTIAATDMVLVQHVSGGTVAAYTVSAVAGAGSATITVRNNTAGALLEAIVIKFIVFKAATA
jgi:hypothetical protein